MPSHKRTPVSVPLRTNKDGGTMENIVRKGNFFWKRVLSLAFAIACLALGAVAFSGCGGDPFVGGQFTNTTP